MGRHYLSITIMTKRYATILSVCAVLLAAAFLSQEVARGESQLETDCRTSSSTTSPTYLTTSGATSRATSTPCNTYRTDMSDINVFFVGSTSDAVLNFGFEFSNNGIDWYGEDNPQATNESTVTHATTTIVHKLQGNTISSTTARNIGIDPISSKQMRLNFSVTGGNGSVWFEASQKIDYSR